MPIPSEELIEEVRYTAHQRDLFEAATKELTVERDSLQKQLDDCLAGNPDPPAVAVRYGACPQNNSNDLASVKTKFGQKASGRWFDNGMGLDRIPSPPDGMFCHYSWKTLQDGVITPEGIDAAFSHLDKKISLVETEHEADVKYKKTGNKIQLEQRRVLKRDFRVLANARGFTVPNTLSAWQFQTDAAVKEVEELFIFAGDVLGIDFDGVNTSYFDWAKPDVLARVQRIADKYYGGRITVPEYGWPRQASDTNGSQRVAAINKQTPIIADALKPIQFVWFDSASFANYPLTLANEKAAWTAFVSTNP